MSDYERTKIDGERHYNVNGTPYPSVTTVTNWHPEKKNAINGWEDKVGEEKAKQIKNEAATLGTLAHHRVLNPIAVRPLPKPDVDFQWMYDGIETDVETAVALWDTLDLSIESNPYVEERIAHHGKEYAGTFDLLSDGTVMDLKTSPKIRDSHKWQIAAYYFAIREDDDLPDARNAAIVRLDPDPETNPSLTAHVEWLDHQDLERYFDVFVDTLETYGP